MVFSDAKATKSKINVANALGTIYTPHCAVIHPGKLVRGLAKTVEKLGAKIYEKSAVTKINSGQVTTLNGKVKAPIIVKGYRKLFMSIRWIQTFNYSFVFISASHRTNSCICKK
ncbi:FAD-dependent oxidoreductase [Acinetobacter baumannii]